MYEHILSAAYDIAFPNISTASSDNTSLSALSPVSDASIELRLIFIPAILPPKALISSSLSISSIHNSILVNPLSNALFTDKPSTY